MASAEKMVLTSGKKRTLFIRFNCQVLVRGECPQEHRKPAPVEHGRDYVGPVDVLLDKLHEAMNKLVGPVRRWPCESWRIESAKLNFCG
jgi:hypothetical protein